MESRVIYIKLKIKRLFWKFGLFFIGHALPEHDFSSLVNRQGLELKAYRAICKHKKTIARYPPFVICADCQKVLRLATEDELKQGEQDRRLNKKLQEVTVESLYPNEPNEFDEE